MSSSRKPSESKPKPPVSDNDGQKKPAAGPNRRAGGPPSWILLSVLLLATLLLLARPFEEKRSEIPYSFFHKQVLAGNVGDLEISGQQGLGEFITPPLLSELKAAESSEPAVTDVEKPQEQTTDTEVPEADTGADTDDGTEDGAAPEGEAVTDGAAEEPTEEPAAEPTASESTDTPDDGNAESVDGATDESNERLEKKFVVTLLSPYIDNETSEFWLANGVKVRANLPTDFGTILYALWLGILVAFMIGMWMVFRRTRDQMMGGGIMGGVARSPARRYDAEGPKTTFDDVAGLEGVKRDLSEVVEFLKEPERFQKLGARVPKGVLLMGPPGTGKTLLAKAVAGEANVPFFSISGSEFIQMFVGVGASRVRDLFKTAKAASPSIMFIDEIDAVGRQRGAGMGGGHDEREQTLNQILSEMDGFDATTSVIVIAATNRPDVLDPALLRPGRFDRHISVDRPSLAARQQLFEVHTRSMPLSEDVDFARLARATVGMTGADIQNLANEAALWATRHSEKNVDMDDFEYARDKVLMGSVRDDVMTDAEKRITAYHEAGHALLAWFLPGNDRVHKVTIIPRGRALGVTQLVPFADRHNMSESDMYATLAMALGGRTAEKITFDEYSAGAESDLKRATDLARKMVTLWGMSERLGPVAFRQSDENPFLGREMAHEHRQYSEHTAQVIDEEVAKILHAAADRAKRTLLEHADDLKKLSEALLEREEIDQDELEALIGPSVNGPPTHEDQPLDVSPPTPTSAATSRKKS